jgi:hypothetical protein
MAFDVVVHDFQEQLAYSSGLSDEAAWVDFYRKLWPDMVACVRLDKNSQFQRWGIDREIYTASGRRFSVDEKKRKDDYGDMLLEEWSVCDYDEGAKVVTRGIKPGWAVDESKRCDFIAYAIPSAGKCWLLPFELLRQTAKHNMQYWKIQKSWYPKAAKNNGYWTVNVAVPYERLFLDMRKQMHRAFGSNLPLPVPGVHGQMCLFTHESKEERA